MVWKVLGDWRVRQRQKVPHDLMRKPNVGRVLVHQRNGVVAVAPLNAPGFDLKAPKRRGADSFDVTHHG
jgi:hypothetical protein